MLKDCFETYMVLQTDSALSAAFPLNKKPCRNTHFILQHLLVMDPKYDVSKIVDDDRVNLGDKNTINLVIYGFFICF